MSDNSDFFKHQTESSKVKATIISEYFPQYCSIISRKHEPMQFGYFDMFAGPGIYEDGSISTPLMVAKNCYDNPYLRDRAWLVFNDMGFGEKLKENFEKYYPSGSFYNEPYFASRVFGECPAIDRFLVRDTRKGYYNECPTVLFIDPWGYKHINTRILARFLTYWGNEVFIFVNTKRLNAAFEQPDFQESLKIIFPETYEEVRTNKSMIRGRPEERHNYIINHLAQEFNKAAGGFVYYTAFQFVEENQQTPSHYLLHITKGAKGFELIKQVFSKYANVERTLGNMGSVETYTFDPKRGTDSLSMFDEEFKQENIQFLKNEICRKYAKKRISSEDLFKDDQTGRLHTRTHYLQALRQLVDEKKINVEYTDGRVHKAPVLISISCLLTFN